MAQMKLPFARLLMFAIEIRSEAVFVAVPAVNFFTQIFNRQLKWTYTKFVLELLLCRERALLGLFHIRCETRVMDYKLFYLRSYFSLLMA